MSKEELYYAKDVYSLDMRFFQKFELIILDLDNTLVRYDMKMVPNRLHEFIDNLKSKGIEILLCSNSPYKRVSYFATHLKIDFISSAHKPLKSKTYKYLKSKGFLKKRILVVGDQVLTDLYLGKKLKVNALLVHPLYNKDRFSTRLKRPLDKMLRKSYLQKNLLINIDRKEI